MNDILRYHAAVRYDAGAYRAYMVADMGNLFVATELDNNRKLFFNTINGVRFIYAYIIMQVSKMAMCCMLNHVKQMHVQCTCACIIYWNQLLHFKR